MTTIDRVTLNHLRMPLQSPFETSFGRINTRDCILIEVNAGNVHAYGECVADRDPGYSSETALTAWHILRDFLIPLLLEKNIQQPGEFQSQALGVRGNYMAKAGLEMALWDLVGKQQGRSLREMIGGSRHQVEVGVSVGIQASPQALQETVARYVEQNYQRVKIKIKPGRDVMDVQAVRQAYPQLRLQVDANSAYTLEDTPILRDLDQFNLLLIEQPLAEDDLWDHSRLQPLLDTPLCLDESILTLRHARQALDMGACRIINIKVGRVGGLSEAIAIHDYCRSKGAPVWCGGMLETGVGRAANLALASLSGFVLPGDISATDRYYAEDITMEQFNLNSNSTIDVPQGSGLGVHLNRTALRRYTLDSLTLP